MPLDNHSTCLKFIQKLHPLGFKKHISVVLEPAGVGDQTPREENRAAEGRRSASASGNFEKFTTQSRATVSHRFKHVVKHLKIHIYIF